jgi:hypothetical protein
MKRNVCGPESLKTFEILARGMHGLLREERAYWLSARLTRWRV